jgi:hypothetical protein
MWRRRRLRFGSERFRRLLAVACAVLLLALSVLAVSPTWHEWLHHDSHSAETDGCAVVIFSLGVTEAATAAILVLIALRLWGKRAPAPVALDLAAPCFQLPPACGPPAA